MSCTDEQRNVGQSTGGDDIRRRRPISGGYVHGWKSEGKNSIIRRWLMAGEGGGRVWSLFGLKSIGQVVNE